MCLTLLTESCDDEIAGRFANPNTVFRDHSGTSMPQVLKQTATRKSDSSSRDLAAISAYRAEAPQKLFAGIRLLHLCWRPNVPRTRLVRHPCWIVRARSKERLRWD